MAAEERTLELGYYHPTDTFRRFTEHVAVMDTSKRCLGDDGELIALFGPTIFGGGSVECALSGVEDAELFIAAPDLLAACQKALAALQGGQERQYWTEELFAMDALRAAIAKAEGDEAEVR